MAGDADPFETALKALAELPDQVTLHLLVAFTQYLEGEHEEAVSSLRLAADMYEVEVLD
jgi:hypothetical protein